MRANLNAEKVVREGTGPEKGNYLVEAASFRNVKTDFKPTQPCLMLDCAVLDADGEPVAGADPLTLRFSLGEKALEAFHPGKVAGPEDANDEDQGASPDAEGNTISAVAANAEVNRSCGYFVFMQSLRKHGFPTAVLDRMYAPDYVGLKFSMDTKPSKDINELYGTRLNTKPAADGGTITYKIAAKWLNPKYLTNGAHSDAGDKPPKIEDLEEICRVVMLAVAAVKPGEKNAIKNKAQLKGFFTNEFTKLGSKGRFDAKKLPAAQKRLFGDDETDLITLLAECGGSYDAGVTTFA